MKTIRRGAVDIKRLKDEAKNANEKQETKKENPEA